MFLANASNFYGIEAAIFMHVQYSLCLLPLGRSKMATATTTLKTQKENDVRLHKTKFLDMHSKIKHINKHHHKQIKFIA